MRQQLTCNVKHIPCITMLQKQEPVQLQPQYKVGYTTTIFNRSDLISSCMWATQALSRCMIGFDIPSCTMSLLSIRELWWPSLQIYRLACVMLHGHTRRFASGNETKMHHWAEIHFLMFLLWQFYHALWVWVHKVCACSCSHAATADWVWLSALHWELLNPSSSSTVCSAVGGGCHMCLHVRLLQEHVAAGGRRPALFSAVQTSVDCSVLKPCGWVLCDSPLLPLHVHCLSPLSLQLAKHMH